MPSSHLILCRPLLLLPPVLPSIRVFSNESTLRMRWPKYWTFSFSIIPSKEIPGLISFGMDWLDLLAVQGTLKSLLQHHSSKAVFGCNLKNDRMISVHFQGKPFNIMVIQVYAPTSNAEEAEVERFYEELQDLLELTPKKGVLFILGDWNAKVGSQETPRVTGKFGLGMQNEAGQRLIRVLPRKCTGHSKHPLPTTQEKTLHMDITTWSTPKSD